MTTKKKRRHKERARKTSKNEGGINVRWIYTNTKRERVGMTIKRTS